MDDSRGLNEGGTWLAEVFVKSLGQSLEAMTSQPASLTWDAVESPAGPDDTEPYWWWDQPVTVAKGAHCWVGAPKRSWHSTGRLALVSAGIDEATEQDCLDTWKEIVLQTVSAAAQAVGRRVRREVNCEGGAEAKSTPPCAFNILVKLNAADGVEIVRFGWDEVFQKALAPEPDPAQASKPRQDQGTSPGGAGSGGAQNRQIPVETSKTLGLLLEVELPISVSFGRAQLPLKDVLKLNSGSIVELNRSISEPVDIIVNNCVIARGEVVVVEGNYGVRIKQIISKEDRLRTLY